MRECSECGASSRFGPVRHAGGCSQAPHPGGGSVRTGKPKDTGKHKHSYVQTGKTQTSYVTEGRGLRKKRWKVEVRHMECAEPGCPRPRYDETTRQEM